VSAAVVVNLRKSCFEAIQRVADQLNGGHCQ